MRSAGEIGSAGGKALPRGLKPWFRFVSTFRRKSHETAQPGEPPYPQPRPEMAASPFEFRLVRGTPTADAFHCHQRGGPIRTGGDDDPRQAIVDSNATPGPNTIDFNIPGPGVQTISPASPLPPITVPVVINGYTQPGASPNTLANGDNAVLLIELDGANAPATTDGLLINAGGSTVEGLVINQFGGDGVQITGSGATGNMVQGNFIGTNAAGTAALGNGTGVVIDSGASNNTIGGTGAGAGNVISGNSSDGIDIGSFSPTVSSGNGNLVQGNKIGTNAAGTAELGNGNPANLGSFGAGVRFIDGMSNTVGGTAAGAGNLISGNVNEGIFFLGNDGASDEMVLGNLVGTNAAGTAAIGNGLSGITLLQSAANTIGGNVISGNGVGPFGGNGITLAGASNNAVLGNFIGTDASGTSPAWQQRHGVLIVNGASNNTIGGTGAGAGNVISANSMTASTSRATATWCRATSSAPTSPAHRPWATISMAFSSATPPRTRSVGRRRRRPAT